MDATRKSRSPEDGLPTPDGRDPVGTLAGALHAAGIDGGSHLCLAYSGGLDSTALLHALHQLQPVFGFRLSAAHVDHGLQPDSATWARACAATAAALGVPFNLLTVAVAQGGDAPGGLEAAARVARYAALAGLDCDRIVLAHHRDDQAETVLLALLRGAGPAGLASMGSAATRPGHPLGRPLLRPWLDLDRSSLLAWAQAQGLVWIEDPSNQDCRLDRNFLRHQIGPALGRRFPGWRAALARSAAWGAESQHLLEQLAELDLRALSGGLPALPGGAAAASDPALLPVTCAALLTLPEARARNLLRFLLACRGIAAPPAARLQDWCRQLTAPGDRLPELAWGAQVLRRWGGGLWLERQVAATAQMAGRSWDGLQPAELCLADGSRLGFTPAAPGEGGDRLPGSARLVRSGCGRLELAPCLGSARLRLHPGGPHREVRKLFQEAGVPPWRRRRMPALFAGPRLAAVAGLAVDADFRAVAGEAAWRLDWRDAGIFPG